MALPLCCGSGFSQSSWTNEIPNFFALTYGEAGFVAGGEILTTSSDGLHWSLNTNSYGFGAQLGGRYGQGIQSIASDGGGHYVAVGPYVLLAGNGVNWTSPEIVPEELFNACAFGNGRFLAVARSGGVYLITTGGAWSKIAQIEVSGGFTYPDYLGTTGIAYGSGKFLVSNTNGRISCSDDGVNWRVVADTKTPLYAAAYAGGRFFVFGEGGAIFCSQNGTNFLKQTSPTTHRLFAVANGADGFIAVGERGVVIRSMDGQIWSTVAVPISVSLRGIGYGSSRWVAVGLGHVLLTSENGQTWVDQTPTENPYEALQGCTYNRGQFIAVGSGSTILTATESSSWKRVFTGDSTLHSVASGKGKLVAVGEAGTILISTNSIDWQAVSSGTAQRLYRVRFIDDNFYVMANNGVMLTSPDAINWTRTLVNTNLALLDIIKLSDRWMISGATLQIILPDGTPASQPPDMRPILVSTNGIDWAFDDMPRDYADTLHSLAYGNGVLVTGGEFGTILYQGADRVWHFHKTITANGQPFQLPVNYVAFANGHFVAVDANGGLSTSRNGEDWTYRPTFTSVGLNCVAASPNQFVVVGGNGVTLRSPFDLFFDKPYKGRGRFICDLYGIGTRTVILENSTNLQDWNTIATYQGTTNATFNRPLSSPEFLRAREIQENVNRSLDQ